MLFLLGSGWGEAPSPSAWLGDGGGCNNGVLRGWLYSMRVAKG